MNDMNRVKPRVPFPLVTLLLVWAAACGTGPRDTSADTAADARGPATVEALDTIPLEEWRQLITGLSEPGGFFDTDNLTSNEQSYLHVLGPMRELGVEGGAYIGVGPDQNFSYMAAQRPWMAYIVDLRRDNLVHHLLLKALFAESGSRMEYLALLFGRSAEGVAEGVFELPVDSLLARHETRPGGAGSAEAEAALHRVRARVETFGLELDENARGTLERFHRSFIEDGPDLRFTSFGREARTQYPTFATLLTERDLEGRQGSYLADRENFLFIRALQGANRVVPIVGDLSGPSALSAVGEDIRARGLVVRVFYTSNVEYYLWNAGTFPDFAATLAGLPMDETSVIVRSVFPNTARHPHTVPGYASTQTLVPMERVRSVIRGSGYRGYEDLVARDAIDPRANSR
jgi:hypothetical protein